MAKKKAKGKVKPKGKARKRKGTEISVFRTDDLFKGRKAGDFSISEDSADEQVQGFLAEMCQRSPRIWSKARSSCRGRTGGGRWLSSGERTSRT